jgi:hypothetical protein
MYIRLAYLLTIALFSHRIHAQFMEQTFSSSWAMTSWTYIFHDDGTYERTSSGHFGNPVFSGSYTMHNDTVQLLSGFKGSSGTLNEFYLLHEDSMLVDLHNFYEYAPAVPGRFHMSRKRYDLMPARSVIPELEPQQDSVARSPQGKQIQLQGTWTLDSTFIYNTTESRMQRSRFGTQYYFGEDGIFTLSEPDAVKLSCTWFLHEDAEGSWIIFLSPSRAGEEGFSERMRLVFTDGRRTALQSGSSYGSYTYYLSRP